MPSSPERVLRTIADTKEKERAFASRCMNAMPIVTADRFAARFLYVKIFSPRVGHILFPLTYSR